MKLKKFSVFTEDSCVSLVPIAPIRSERTGARCRIASEAPVLTPVGRSGAPAASGALAWGVPDFRHHLIRSVSRQGRARSASPFSSLPIDCVLSAIGGHRRKLERVTAVWKADRWRRADRWGGGGRGARRTRAPSSASGYLPRRFSLQLLPGSNQLRLSALPGVPRAG